jgi:hypothetical protein
MRRLIPTVWLVGLLVAPGVAWVLGARQGNLDNRTKTAFPTINRSSVRSGKVLTQLDAAFLERLPGRKQGLQVRARIAVDVFRDSTNPDVAIGDGGWLYYGAALDPCRPDGAAAANPADAVDILARGLLAGGRRALVMQPAEKTFIETARAPDADAAAQRCAAKVQHAIESRLATTPGGATIDPQLRAVLARGGRAFLRSDTHWSWEGREVFVRRVLDFARPGLARETGLRVGRAYDRAGDLGVLLGLDRRDPDHFIEVTGPPARPLPPGDVLLIGDSQTDRALIEPVGDDLRPIRDVALAGQPWCTWDQVTGGACDDQIRAANAVSVETVGRSVRIMGDVCSHLLGLSAERLRGAAGRFADGSRQVRLAGAPTGPLAASLPGGDRTPLPRLALLRLRRMPSDASTAVTLSQAPADGILAPCVVGARDKQGAALVLPIPANRSVSALRFTLAGPPGAVVGPPEEVILDGRPASHEEARARPQ